MSQPQLEVGARQPGSRFHGRTTRSVRETGFPRWHSALRATIVLKNLPDIPGEFLRKIFLAEMTFPA
jgi:hypothetical protein